MKCSALIVLLFLSLSLAAQSPFEPKPKAVAAPPEEIYTTLEEMPVFPGGPEAMQKYLDDNIAQPAKIRGACRAKRLIAAFVVEKDGSLSKVDIIESVNGCPDYDFEVLRVIRTMPKWVAARLNGKSVRCYYKMPVYIG